MIVVLSDTVNLPASVGAALRSVLQRVTSSVKFVWRAHTSPALRWSASETVIGTVSVPRLTRSLRLHPAESSRVRVRAFPLRFSASSWGLGSHRHPPPPNNSFKPTPCRGVSRVLYATLAHVRHPATGRLNSSVRAQWRRQLMFKYFLAFLLTFSTFFLSGCGTGESDEHRNAVNNCVQRGVQYFKDIDSYPTLKTKPNVGRSAEDVAVERCNRTVTAF